MRLFRHAGLAEAGDHVDAILPRIESAGQQPHFRFFAANNQPGEDEQNPDRVRLAQSLSETENDLKEIGSVANQRLQEGGASSIGTTWLIIGGRIASPLTRSDRSSLPQAGADPIGGKALAERGQSGRNGGEGRCDEIPHQGGSGWPPPDKRRGR